MNAECLKKIRRLGANAESRKRIIASFWRCQPQHIYTEKYRQALLERYPAGLVDEVEIQALLMSWNKPAAKWLLLRSDLIRAVRLGLTQGRNALRSS
jgi:hypothetical protein